MAPDEFQPLPSRELTSQPHSKAIDKGGREAGRKATYVAFVENLKDFSRDEVFTRDLKDESIALTKVIGWEVYSRGS